jgi:hypothetical protein
MQGISPARSAGFMSSAPPFALYFNVFVGIVQSFEKIPAPTAMAPTQSEPPFKLTQLVVLALFVVLTFVAAIRFRPEPLRVR